MKKEIKTLLRDKMLEDENNKKSKDSFWASESETNVFDIYHRWMGTLPTNPITPENKLGLNVRKLVELGFVSELRELGILYEEEEEKQLRVELEREGVKITGYIDAIIEDKDGTDINFPAGQNLIPVEFKTSFGSYQKVELDKGFPKTSYLKQLAIYMDGLDLKMGYLIQAHFKDNFIVDEIYQFPLVREDDGTFSSGAIRFDINDTYKKWARLYRNNIIPKIEPKSEYVYKYPIDELDWTSLPSNKISNARNNRAVIGDWQVTYSDYKNLIIEREGTVLGYTEDEIKRIQEMTTGYTTKAFKK